MEKFNTENLYWQFRHSMPVGGFSATTVQRCLNVDRHKAQLIIDAALLNNFIRPITGIGEYAHNDIDT